jgi:hypothetical protein|tara:strand:+ start:31497 stop:31856 length:360 start_codon:yes stop_codon:yes gene_type:complete
MTRKIVKNVGSHRSVAPRSASANPYLDAASSDTRARVADAERARERVTEAFRVGARRGAMLATTTDGRARAMERGTRDGNTDAERRDARETRPRAVQGATRGVLKTRAGELEVSMRRTT